jgi:hypothetical protein
MKSILLAIAFVISISACGMKTGEDAISLMTKEQVEVVDSKKVSLEDRVDILELISEYAFAFDEDRISDYVELFQKDAELSFYSSNSDEPISSVHSNAERLVESQELRSGPFNEAGQPRHIQTNTILKYISRDRISGRTLVVCTQQPYDGSESKTLFTGVYEDEYQRTPNGWKFAIRRGYLDIYDIKPAT